MNMIIEADMHGLDKFFFAIFV